MDLRGMEITQLRREAAYYRAIELGGGEGYNPFEAEIARRGDTEPVAPQDAYMIRRAMNALDFAMIRVPGSLEAIKYEQLQAELARITKG